MYVIIIIIKEKRLTMRLEGDIKGVVGKTAGRGYREKGGSDVSLCQSKY